MKSILLVDDDPLQTDLLKEEVELAGYRAVCVNSGHDALAYLEREMVDVVISDVGMPRMSGPQLLVAIRKRWPVRPGVILVSAFADLTPAAALAMGAQALLDKPIDLDELYRHIGVLCAHRDAPPSCNCNCSQGDGSR
jgi:CheY-like chemotaxis protein